MTKGDLFPAWRRILSGGKPLLSVEITKECPLRCPGCYAFEPEHLGDAGPLRLLSDYRGQTLVDGFLSLVRKQRPIHVSIVGGEPLVRYRELDEILPRLERMGIEVQLVTSAVRPIPSHWAELRNLHLVVSVDGLQPEHDRRRAPATYDRIQKHIAGHTVIVHCTVTRQMLARSGYLEDFTRFWSDKAEVRKVWFSLFTPQEGSECAERLEPADRSRVLSDLAALRPLFPKVHLPEIVLRGLETPPQSPEECIFAQTTTCVSADFTTRITPCQFGGQPVCAECGCLASAGLAAIGRVRLGGLVSVARLFSASRKFGHAFAGKDAA
ncbi:MAG: radical SAM protein [Bryobacterales bacterium]|nr:radical SAM protein [Bryobacterales bacterium]